MDFRLSDEAEALRKEARAFFTTWMTPELEERVYRSGVSHDEDFVAALVEQGWFAPSLRPEIGGAGLDPLDALGFEEEIHHFDAPIYLAMTTRMVATLIDQVGQEEMKRKIVRDALTGKVTIALGFTEPESGSDVAAAATRARRDGGEWVIDGQKMFTTNAHVADYVFLLTRTNTEVAKHRGLTTFLVPLRHPGVEVHAVYTLSGERTNITYYNDVRVGDDARIGEVDGGWAVMTLSLQDEHSSGWGQHEQRLVDEAERWAQDATDATGRPRLDDPAVRVRLARAATEVEVSRLLERRAVWMTREGEVPEVEGPMAKLFSTEALVRAAQDLFEMVGPDALRARFEPTAPRDGRFEHLMRFSLGTTIYAGTSEVQRMIVAQRGLGLPR
jgi:alkylation response protein AidB-like acyl-CoA dehydrogenase